MQLHEADRERDDCKADDAIVAAWVALTRAQRGTIGRVEARLKEAGFPPLSWYDALWELEKVGPCGMRPFELERAMLFEQYNLSRLADRLEKAGLVERGACPGDRRGQVLRATEAGQKLRREMWKVYAEAIQEAVGARLSAEDARTLAELLGKLE
jgi:DNA-binding MarR family transcriptional regulator